MLEDCRKVRGRTCDYLLGELIGQGQFGKVYRGRSALYPEGVAVKIIRRSKFSRNEKLKHLLQREVEVLSSLEHKNIIQFIELIAEGQDICLVYQYCEEGTLEDRIGLSQQDVVPLFDQLLKAMCHAEKKGIIHRDIKPANILFKQGTLKIADWGFSRLLSQGETTCSFIGSPAYMAPEILKGKDYSLKADVWSLGVVLYETLTGLCPWNSKSIHSLCNEIQNKPLIFPKSSKISAKMKNIITKMLSPSEVTRPTFSQIRILMKETQKMSQSSKSDKKLQPQILSIKENKENVNGSPQQHKILSCVFFLELVQWARKSINCSNTLLTFVQLIQKNLLKLKPTSDDESQIRHVWEKEIAVISQLKRKLESRLSEKSKLSTEDSCSQDLNPEGEWQGLVKRTVKLAMDELELAYSSSKRQSKQIALTEINLLLDLILFHELPKQYLHTGFKSYNTELMLHTPKTLLKLINRKLLLINKRYYR